MDLSNTEIAVLKVMHSRKIYGSNHKQIETITHSGFPKHEIKNVKKAISSLMKLGFIQYYDKSRNAIQLNINKSQEIEEIINQNT